MTERVLSTRELNRALLARQLLLERSSLPLEAALEQDGRIELEPFEPLAPATRRALEDEAERPAAFHDG